MIILDTILPKVENLLKVAQLLEELRGGQTGNRILSPSFESGIDRFINAQTGTGTADAGRGQAQGSTKINVTCLKPTSKGRGPKLQPRPTTRSTIKSMPARMMGKPAAVKAIMPGKASVTPKPLGVQPVVPTPRPIENPGCKLVHMGKFIILLVDRMVKLKVLLEDFDMLIQNISKRS